jgi:hypothetical protein
VRAQAWGRAALDELRTDRSIHLTAALLIGLGAVVRLAQYFSGSSFWLDEAALALNVFNRSAAGLAETLDFGQATPLGFLLAAKAVVVSGGKSELALRLVPLVFGLASLPLFYVVARKLTSHGAALIGLLLFAAAEGPIQYAAEFKQYSDDLFAAVALLAVAVSPELTWLRYRNVSLLGAAVLWFSHASLFVLASISCAYGLVFVVERRWGDLRRSLAASVVWVASLAVFYVVSIRHANLLRENILFPGRLEAGSDDPFRSVTAWFRKVAGDLGNQIGLPESQAAPAQLVRVLAAILAVVAIVALLRRRWPVALMLGLPALFVQIATELELYPLYARTILFLVPIVLLLVAHGIAVAVGRLPRSVAVPAALALAALVSAHSVAQTAGRLADPREREEIKPLLRELAERWQPGDTLYVHYGAEYAFRYYAECDCVGDAAAVPPLSLVTPGPGGPRLFAPGMVSRPPELIAGSYDQWPPWRTILAEVDELRGRERVWLLHSHFLGAEERFLNVTLPRRLEQIGELRAEFARTRARLLLFDLSSPS